MFREVLPEPKIVPISNALTVEGISAVIREKLDDLERKSSGLRLIGNHQAFVLLKNSFYVTEASIYYTSFSSI